MALKTGILDNWNVASLLSTQAFLSRFC